MGQKSGEKWTAAAKLQPTFPKPDRLLGEFELLAVAGEGGFGIVYRAWDHSLKRQVALKGVPARHPGDAP